MADVVVSNFRPGTMERHGLGYEDLRAGNPRLIWAAISGYGLTGPNRDLSSADAIAQAMGGTMSLNGYPDRGPLRMGAPVGDTVAGLYLAIGVLAALQARHETGEGQAIDIALTETQMALCDIDIVRHSATGEAPLQMGSRHPSMAPFGPFPAADGYLVVANITDWPVFCGLIGREELAADARFRNNRSRVANVDELEAALIETLQTRPVGEWLDLLQRSDAGSFSRVNGIPDLSSDPQVVAREMLVEVPLPYGKAGAWTVPASPIHLSKTPARSPERMPGYGEHTDEVLASWLSLEAEEIAGLRGRGAIA
jgi:CoA:oxalate CoA-transferase